MNIITIARHCFVQVPAWETIEALRPGLSDGILHVRLQLYFQEVILSNNVEFMLPYDLGTLSSALENKPGNQ